MKGLVVRIAVLRAELVELDRELARPAPEGRTRELAAKKRAALSRLSSLTGRLVAAKRALRPKASR